MGKRFEIEEKELGTINGGQITYTWDGEVGTIGKDGVNPYTLLDKDAFIEYYDSVRGTKTDAQILRYLLENGIARA